MSAFRQVWAELLKEGWSSKRPTGLEVDHTYLRPGKTKKDKRGVDFFVGAQELMVYLGKLALGTHGTICGWRIALSDTNGALVDGIHQPAAAKKAQRNEKEQSRGTVQSSSSLFVPDPTTTTDDSGRPAGEAMYPQVQVERNLTTAFAEVASNSKKQLHCPTSPHVDDEDVNAEEESADDASSDLESVESVEHFDINFNASDELEDEDEAVTPDLQFDEALLAAVGGMEGLTIDNLTSKRSSVILDKMASSGWLDPTYQAPYPYMEGPYKNRADNGMREDYPGLFDGQYRPTQTAMAAAVTPVCALFYFMTPGLWDDISTASDDYFVEKIDERVNEQYQKQVAREQKKPEQIRVKLEQTPPITGRDLGVFIGLLVARTISPNKEKLQHHWKTTDEGAIPRGCFGRFMARDCFAHVSRNLHFRSNTDPRAATDRAWKLRPVIEALQETFRAGYMPPPVMAFDEAMFPSRSSFNRMRVYMKDKPHKYGTKLFMLCCSQTAYCIR
ncbi:unnamed protein product [Phytophthora fragariaefolia]|uniref:Unnamed protein product n=1 Tax=Phytophthora fragariaefolia TaxID=1490495 RepID=A0A9W6XUA7_9STRA|nr:unnamed protein product [Phytophthora fragariaefolia]